ncbi:reverse transcriptase from mobile element jockey protein, partial [Rhizoctonia solani AG-3 Rhs1AP]
MYFCAFNIILVQDPWWGNIGRAKHIDPSQHVIYGTVNSPNWICLIPPGSSGPRGPGVVIYIRKGVKGLTFRFSDILPAHPDILAIDIYIHKSRTSIINVYLHGEHHNDALTHLISHPIPADHPLIIAGDFNLHHHEWALKGSSKAKAKPSLAAESLHDWIVENDLHIVNDFNTPTRRGRGKQEDSIIDLTIWNRHAMNAFQSFNWECSEEGSADSDHNAITWTLTPHDQVDTSGVTEPSPGYVIDEALKNEWVTAYKQAIEQAEIPSSPRTAEEAERSAQIILEAMSNATSKVMPIKKTGKRGIRSPWWNEECSRALRAVKEGTGRDSDTRADLASALRGAIRRARRSHADRICQRISTADEAFKVTNWYKGKRCAPLPPIKFQGNLVTHPADKAKAFTETFFPKHSSPNISLEPHGVPYVPKRDFHPITEEEILNALSNSSNTSAPGAFGTNYRLLKWAFAETPGIITGFYNSCLNLGYHPICLRNAVISIIPKPRRPDMALPKSYRPISLLETLSKCLEKVIANRLIFEAGKFDLIPQSQFGGRDLTSCTDAGLCLMHDIRTLWAKGKYVSLLTMDVSGYFNNIDHARLTYTLDRLGYANEICQWISSYLTNRTAQPKVDNVLCDPIALPSVGVPQGSPLSPILSSLYSIPLLCSIQDTNAHTFAYIDDFSILVYSHSHSHNVDILQDLVDNANTTLSYLGLDFEIPKSDLIHFVSPRQRPSSTKLVIHHIDGNEYVIEPRHVVRWLGFYLDQKLDFKDHVRYMSNKANAVLSGLKMLANTVRGLSVKHARLLYITCVRPILTYGSLLWAHGRRQKSLTGVLERSQNIGLRWLLGAFKTTPVRSMEHLASIPPMHVYLRKLSMNAAAKLRALPKQAELARRLPASWGTHDKTAIHTRRSKLAIHQQSPITRLANLSHPQAEPRIPYLNTPWIPDNPYPERLVLIPYAQGKAKGTRVDTTKNANRLIDALVHEGTLVGFADGSKVVTEGECRVGLGFSITLKGKEIGSHSRGIGPRADNYDAEMLAIALLAQNCVAIAEERRIRSIHIFSDNQSAVMTINSPKAHPAQYASLFFREHVHAFLANDSSRTFTVQWIPGHSGIPGNNRADSLANLGAQAVPTPLFDRTATWIKSNASDTAREAWIQVWNQSKCSEHTRRFMPNPPSLKINAVFAKDPPSCQVSSRLVQLITGHGFYGEYRARFFPNEDTSCTCGEAIQTVPHYLFQCPHTEAQRHYLTRISPDLNPAILFGSPKGLAAIIRFIEHSDIGCPT